MMKKNILIYSIGSLGDTLIAVPAIQAIVNRHPDCHMVFLADRHLISNGYVSSWDVVGTMGYFDEVVFYDAIISSTWGRIKSILALVQRLKRYHFICAYNLVQRTTMQQVRRDEIFFSHIVGVKKYLGSSLPYPSPNNKSGKLTLMPPKWRQLLELVSNSNNVEKFHLPLPVAAYNELEYTWPNHLDKNQKIVAFIPGSKMSAKCWPESRFTDLGRLLLQHIPDLKIVIVGGTEDTQLGDRLCNSWGGNHGVNFAGKLSVMGSAALLKYTTLYIGNDTGTMHLAAMVGVPCVAIFSSRDYPGRWDPFGSNHTILRRDLDCSGCMLHTCVALNNACLDGISTVSVFNAVLKQLERLKIT
jgi:ADP-heptose:LPS heptosyltransferase